MAVFTGRDPDSPDFLKLKLNSRRIKVFLTLLFQQPLWEIKATCNCSSNHSNGCPNVSNTRQTVRSDQIKVSGRCLILLRLLVLGPLGDSRLFICSFRVQEYNIHGWWVGELNGTVGIVPKDFLHPAYILWAPTGTEALSYHQHYGPLLWPNTQKRSPWYSSRLPSRYIQSLTCRLWHLLAGRSTA